MQRSNMLTCYSDARKEATMTSFFIGFIIGFAGCVVGYYLAKRFWPFLSSGRYICRPSSERRKASCFSKKNLCFILTPPTAWRIPNPEYKKHFLFCSPNAARPHFIRAKTKYNHWLLFIFVASIARVFLFQKKIIVNNWHQNWRTIVVKNNPRKQFCLINYNNLQFW